jgi:predicted ATPase with chaperone activity
VGKLARTIADLIGAAPSAFAPGCFTKRIETAHLAEAIQYRLRWQV